MKFLVTGGAGFIGSALCRHLVGTLGHSVVIVDKLTYAGNLSSLAPILDRPQLTFVQADICDRDAMDAVFAEHAPDAVFHLAAESHVDRSIGAPQTFVVTNVLGAAVLLEAARQYWERLVGQAKTRFRFLHVSTDEVFGSLGPSGHFQETTAYDPRSPYSASKASSDHLVRAWGHTYGLPVLVSNCSNNYGPYQLPEKLIPLTILNAMDGASLPVYGDGQNIRDWLHVEDHVAALLTILEKGAPGETYNVGSRNEQNNLQVVEQICRFLERHAPAAHAYDKLIRFVADRPGHDRRYAVDPSKLERLGWTAKHNFADGLEETVRWYLANRAWWEPLRAKGHGKSRLGQTKAPA